jgi:hypothetical protein
MRLPDDAQDELNGSAQAWQAGWKTQDDQRAGAVNFIQGTINFISGTVNFISRPGAVFAVSLIMMRRGPTIFFNLESCGRF